MLLHHFFKNDGFVRRSVDDTLLVQNGHKVHLPQSGGLPGVTVNPTSFPVAATQRVDTTITYDLDWFTSAPTNITEVENIELSYDKRTAVLAEHTGALSNSAANWLIYRWSPTVAAQQVRTSGADHRYCARCNRNAQNDNA